MFDPQSPFTTTPDPLQPRQKSDLAEDRLRLAVLTCQLAPGATSTEAELADRFGLGRAATRAALAKLSSQGLMLALPRLGWRALPMTGGHVGQVIQALGFAEAALADAVLCRADLARLQELSTIAMTLQDRPEGPARDSLHSYERAIRDLVGGRINPLTAQFLASLWDKADRIRRFFELTTDARRPARDTAGFCQALMAGNAAALALSCDSDLRAFRDFAADGLLQGRNELDFHPSQGGTKTAPARSAIRAPMDAAATAIAPRKDDR